MYDNYQQIDIGDAVNDHKGDPFRTVAQKMNANFTQLVVDLAAIAEVASSGGSAVDEILAAKGAANGFAPLDANAQVPAANLPSYVDDVLEFDNQAAFPATGEKGKIYVAVDTNKTYRWSGSVYTEIASSPGSTDVIPEGVSNLWYTDARARAVAGVDASSNSIRSVKLPAASTVPLAIRDSSNGAAKTGYSLASANVTAGTWLLVNIPMQDPNQPLLVHLRGQGYSTISGRYQGPIDLVISVNRAEPGNNYFINNCPFPMEMYFGTNPGTPQVSGIAVRPLGVAWDTIFIEVAQATVSSYAPSSVVVSDNDLRGWSFASPGGSGIPLVSSYGALSEVRRGLDHGQCLLSLVGAQASLVPCNGNGLVINGRQFRVPSAGISVPATGLAASSTVYIFAKDSGDGSTPALEFGTLAAGRSRHTDGVFIKTGDSTRTLVGMGRVGATAGQFSMVSSFFNRVGRVSSEFASGTVQTTTATAIGTGLAALVWSEDLVTSSFMGSMYSNTGGAGCYPSVWVSVNDGAFGSVYDHPGLTAPGANFSVPVSGFVPARPADGWRQERLYARGNNAAYTTVSSFYHSMHFTG